MIFYTFFEENLKLPEQRKIAHALLAEALEKRFGIKKFTLKKAEKGKPFLAEYPEVHFNISHCAGLAVCGVSDSEIGVDAELIRPYRKNAVKRIFSPEEQAFAAASENPDEDFFRIWTLKESLCKFTGEGIFSGLSGYSFDISGKTPFCKECADKIFTQKIIEKKWVVSVCAHDREENFELIETLL